MVMLSKCMYYLHLALLKQISAFNSLTRRRGIHDWFPRKNRFLKERLIVWLSDCPIVLLSDCLIVWMSDCLIVRLSDCLMPDCLSNYLSLLMNSSFLKWKWSIILNGMLTKYLTKNGITRMWILRRLKSNGASESELKFICIKQIRPVLEYAAVCGTQDWHK